VGLKLLNVRLIPKNRWLNVSMPTGKATPKPVIDKADVLRLIQSITIIVVRCRE